MKKTLIALAVLGASAGVTYAQSNVTIYGVVDTGLIKESDADVRMGGNEDSRLGFRGVEDLGSGMKATFQLEQRLNLNDGTKGSNRLNAQDLLGAAAKAANSSNPDLGSLLEAPEWQGAANVGLQSDVWGAVRLGRVNNLAVETYRMLDPFNQNGVGSGLYTLLDSEANSDTIRYDSPNWQGFGFGASYTLGGDTQSNDILDEYGNDGFAVNLKYDNGPILLLANYDRLADSSDSYKWDLGGAYKFGGSWGSLRVSAGYEDATLKISDFGFNDDIEQKNWLVGLQYKTGVHTVNASYNRGKVEWNDVNVDSKVNKYSLGYTYDLSKRTSLYANVSYLDADDGIGAAVYSNGELSTRLGYAGLNENGSESDSITSVQVGITHRF